MWKNKIQGIFIFDYRRSNMPCKGKIQEYLYLLYIYLKWKNEFLKTYNKSACFGNTKKKKIIVLLIRKMGIRF